MVTSGLDDEDLRFPVIQYREDAEAQHVRGEPLAVGRKCLRVNDDPTCRHAEREARVELAPSHDRCFWLKCRRCGGLPGLSMAEVGQPLGELAVVLRLDPLLSSANHVEADTCL